MFWLKNKIIAPLKNKKNKSEPDLNIREIKKEN